MPEPPTSSSLLSPSDKDEIQLPLKELDNLTPPLVSVILPCYNESKEVISAISEIKKQTYREAEVILVDDGSTDNTVEIARDATKDERNFRIVEMTHHGLTHARNVGIKESKGEIVFFAESDCVYDPTYLEEAIQSFEQNSEASAVCLTGGPLKLRSTLATESVEIENLLQHKFLKEGKIKPFYAWIFRKEALLKIGGFDETLFQGEDKDIFRRFTEAGYKVAWVPGIHWRHKRDETTLQLARKYVVRGQSRLLYVLKHRLMLDLGKKVGPLWLLILGLGLLFFLPTVGALLVLLVAAAIAIGPIRNMVLTWSLVSKKRYLIGYPIFVAIRNLSTGLGYTIGLVKLLFGRKL